MGQNKKERKKLNWKQHSPEELMRLVDEYIEQEGFENDTISFGTVGRGSGYSERQADVATRYVLVSVSGFSVFLNKSKNYVYQVYERIEEQQSLELRTYIKEKFQAHNSKGVSLKHIEKSLYDSWHKSTFEREEIETTKAVNKTKLEQEKIKLKQMQLLVDKIENDKEFNVSGFEAISAIMRGD